MTGHYRISPRAQRDLDEIWEYTQRNWGIDQAELYVRQIAGHIQMISERPSTGRACPEVRAGYYKYPSGSHLLFYRMTGDGIDVVRILHDSMDFGRHL